MNSYLFSSSLRSLSEAVGLTDQDRALVSNLVQVWQQKISSNQKRSDYYDAHIPLKDLGIAIPPELKNFSQYVSWPAKAVDALADRSQFDGFVCDDAETSAMLFQLVEDNNLKRDYRKAVLSELKHSCSFLCVTKGDTSQGEPTAIISSHPATAAAAIWDAHKKRISAGFVIVESTQDSTGATAPSWVNVFTDAYVIRITRPAHQISWKASYLFHSMGRCLMEPLSYSATLDRPFGKSRISRAVMSITDDAVRAAVRSEIAGEFAASPQKYLLGADPEALGSDTKWDAYIGRIFSVSRDGNGDIPEFGQLPQGSVQPHIDYMRSLAARFSGETNVPLSSLGVISDNPSSAEAIYAAKEDLVIDAQNLNADNAEALKAVAIMCLAIQNDTTYATEAAKQRTIQAKFKNPAMPSVVSQSDAIVKMVSALPWLAESDVVLEELGFSTDQIQRLQPVRRRALAREGFTNTQKLMLQSAQNASQTNENTPESAENVS